MEIAKVLGRSILGPYRLERSLKEKFPKRKIICDVHCEDDRYYYFNGRKILRTVILDSIYTSIRDEIGWPTGLLKKIWPK